MTKELDILIRYSCYMRLTCSLKEILGLGCLLCDFAVGLNIRTCTFRIVRLIMSRN